VTEPFVKRRARATPGSIPDVLQMFTNEVRFYREVAAVVGIRVPTCLKAEVDDGATLLVLENLSDWRPGADPTAAARVLSAMHERWQNVAHRQWPWLRTPVHPALGLVGNLFDSVWPAVSTRPECTAAGLGDALPAAVCQAVLSLADTPPSSDQAVA
jgi:hypothetical protein